MTKKEKLDMLEKLVIFGDDGSITKDYQTRNELRKFLNDLRSNKDETE